MQFSDISVSDWIPALLTYQSCACSLTLNTESKSTHVGLEGKGGGERNRDSSYSIHAQTRNMNKAGGTESCGGTLSSNCW